MNLCHILVNDFMHGDGRFDPVLGTPGYDDYDAINGEAYALDLIEAGHVADPMDGFDLRAFATFCRTFLSRSTA